MDTRNPSAQYSAGELKRGTAIACMIAEGFLNSTLEALLRGDVNEELSEAEFLARSKCSQIKKHRRTVLMD